MDEIIKLRDVIEAAIASYRDVRTSVQVALANSDEISIDGPVNEIVAARETAQKSVRSAITKYLNATDPKPTFRGEIVNR